MDVDYPTKEEIAKALAEEEEYVGDIEPAEVLLPENLANVSMSDDFVHQFNQRSATVFLIDFRKAMFERQTDGSYHFKKGIECCRDVMLNLARKQHRNYATGIIVFGTEKTSEPTVPHHVAVLQPIGLVSAERITELNDLLISDFKDLKQKFGQSETFSLNLALQYSQISIKKWKQMVYRKGIILFTNDDDPYKDDIKRAHNARKQAEELSFINIDLNLVPFGKFDANKFYKELVLTAKDVSLEDWSQCEAVTSIENIAEEVENIVSKFSSHFRLLRLGNDREILVTLSRVYSEPVKKFHREVAIEDMKFDEQVRQNNRPNTSSSADQQSNQPPVLEPDLVFSKDMCSYNIGGRTVEMSKSDIKWSQLKTGIGYTLIGFARTQNIPEYWTVKNPYLMLPYEKDPGATELWKYLYFRCKDRGLSMICWYMFHKNCRPAPVSLDPIDTKSYSGHEPETCQGFVVRFLPYLDNIIDVEEDESLGLYEPTEEQKAAADLLVKNLTFPYKVEMFHDLEFRSFIGMIEALALKYDDYERFEDDTIVDKLDMDERIGESVLNGLAGPNLSSSKNGVNEEANGEEEGPGKKRKGGGAEGRPRKQAKELDVQDMIDIVRERKADCLNMQQLKALLRHEGVKCVSLMTKQKLVEAAYSIFCRDQ